MYDESGKLGIRIRTHGTCVHLLRKAQDARCHRDLYCFSLTRWLSSTYWCTYGITITVLDVSVVVVMATRDASVCARNGSRFLDCCRSTVFFDGGLSLYLPNHPSQNTAISRQALCLEKNSYVILKIRQCWILVGRNSCHNSYTNNARLSIFSFLFIVDKKYYIYNNKNTVKKNHCLIGTGTRVSFYSWGAIILLP